MTGDTGTDAEAGPPVLGASDLVSLGELHRSEGEAVPDRRDVEPYLAALFQAEHLNVLIGAGLTVALSSETNVPGPDMSTPLMFEDAEFGATLERAAAESAARTGRGDSPNLEDRLRIAMTVEAGLRIAGDDRAGMVADAIAQALSELRLSVAATEQGIAENAGETIVDDLTIVGALISFLAAFAGRAPTRDRVHMFTTNYDRVLEWGAERAGLRIVDRFVGSLEPVFRSSRLETDMHYSPPGTVREPRHLDGVFRLTKLHGSLDWRWDEVRRQVLRVPAGFGSAPATDDSELLIFPNAAKDFETAFHPYSELFRDFSSALCRPHSVLVTYGYSFGDDHLNRVIADMLTIPSTHLLVISYDDASERIARFAGQHRRTGQISQMLGPSFASLPKLVADWLPMPSAEFLLQRRATIYRSRDVGGSSVREGDAAKDA